MESTNHFHLEEQLLASSSNFRGVVNTSIMNTTGFHFYPNEEDCWGTNTSDLVQQFYHPKISDSPSSTNNSNSKGYCYYYQSQNFPDHHRPVETSSSSLDLVGPRFHYSHVESEDGFSFGFNYVQTVNLPQLSSSSDKVCVSNNGFGEGKRRSESTAENAPKKSRLETRPSSCPPLKVRKEKLGDRIAALQHLVAPFGKTDTASVLAEAIGYIKFLHSQVETLSVPYMKSSSRKKSTNSKIKEEEEDDEDGLKSRGLCLVPLSCLSFIADGVGGGGWRLNDHRGGGGF